MCLRQKITWVMSLATSTRRRGMIKSQEPGVTGTRVKGDVPLAEMFGYIGDLRTMTSGRPVFDGVFALQSLSRIMLLSKLLRKLRNVRRINSSYANSIAEFVYSLELGHQSGLFYASLVKLQWYSRIPICFDK